MEGYQITETLAREGERVSAGQVLARATRLPAEGQAAATAARHASAAGHGGAARTGGRTHHPQHRDQRRGHVGRAASRCSSLR